MRKETPKSLRFYCAAIAAITLLYAFMAISRNRYSFSIFVASIPSLVLGAIFVYIVAMFRTLLHANPGFIKGAHCSPKPMPTACYPTPSCTMTPDHKSFPLRLEQS